MKFLFLIITHCAYQLYRKVLDIHSMAANFQSS